MIVCFRFNNIAEVTSDFPTIATFLNESLTKDSSISARASSIEDVTTNLNEEHKTSSNGTATGIKATEDSQLESSSVSSVLGTTNVTFLNDSSAKESIAPPEKESSLNDISLNRNISLTTNTALETNRTVDPLSDSATTSFSLESKNVTFVNYSIAKESITPEQESSTDDKALNRDDENSVLSTTTLQSQSVPVSTVLEDKNIDDNSMISTGSISVTSNSSNEIVEAAISTIESVVDTGLPDLSTRNIASKIAQSTESPSQSQSVVSVREIEVGHKIRELETEIFLLKGETSSKVDDRPTESTRKQNTPGRMVRRLYYIILGIFFFWR